MLPFTCMWSYLNSFGCRLFMLLMIGGGIAGCGSTPPSVMLEDAPEELTVGELGIFEFSYNRDATEPVTVTWDLGDGTTYSSVLTTHRFQEPGEYTVTFEARNDAGTARDALRVYVSAANPLRIAEVAPRPLPVAPGESITFDNTVEGPSSIQYQWDFGDGNTSEKHIPTHIYTAEGTYEVILTVHDDTSSDTYTTSVSVYHDEPAMCADIVDLNPAFFEPNSSTLADEARDVLSENARLLIECPRLTVRLTGQPTATEQESVALLQDRLQAVADFYAADGVDTHRIEQDPQSQPAQDARKGDADLRRIDTIPIQP